MDKQMENSVSKEVLGNASGTMLIGREAIEVADSMGYYGDYPQVLWYSALYDSYVVRKYPKIYPPKLVRILERKV